MIPRVDLQAQYLRYRDEIHQAVDRVLNSGRYTLGPEVSAFEAEFADYLDVRDVVGVGDGTRAIALALNVLGVGPGDEVVTTPFTAVPTIGAILETGATPVFVDIELDSYLIDVERAAAAVTSRTKAILPVHMFGNVVDIARLRALVGGEIAIIEDAAQAHGSRRDGRCAGSFGDLATFSFYPTKNLGAYGDGGAVATGNPEFAERLRRLRNHGMVDKDTCAEPGVNSRLDELQAAILRAKLIRLDEMNAARKAAVERYIEGLPPGFLQPQAIPPGVEPNWHVFQLRCLGDRDGLVRHLDSRGIQSNVYYVVPHHLQPAFRHLGYQSGDFPNLERLCGEAIALPLYPEIPAARVDDVVEQISFFCEAARSHTARRQARTGM